MAEPREEPPTSAPTIRPPAPPAIAPDPEAYDHPRGVQARARGLSAPYIPGGRDPDPTAARAEERRYLRLLLAMVVVVALSGFVLGVVANLLRAP
jgi:hypothetical protein